MTLKPEVHMLYEYKTVPAPMVLSIKNEKEAHAAIRSFSDLLNDEAGRGWEFHSMETISTEEAPGCLSGGKAKTMHYNMLVFKRPRQAGEEE